MFYLHLFESNTFNFYIFPGANDILEVIDLSWNQIRGKGAIAVAKGIGVSCFTSTLFNWYASLVVVHELSLELKIKMRSYS